MITETGARSYGMIHDPLCPYGYQRYEGQCEQCKLIAEAYRRGYEDAIEDIKGE